MATLKICKGTLTFDKGETLLSSLLITLREGLEAALIVAIIAAYLRRTGRRDALGAIWLGVGAAVAVSVAAGLIVAFGAASLSDRSREIFEGAASFVAVGVLTWMIFWMRRQARSIKGSLESATDRALTQASRKALVALAFTAVVREGLETVLFMHAAFRNATSAGSAGIGAVLGLVIAVALGYGIYSGGVKLNLRRFFQVTGGLIIVVAAGLLMGAIHEFNEAGLLLFATGQAWDTSGFITKEGFVGSVLRGLFGYRPKPTVFEAVMWVGYLIPTLFVFYRPGRNASGKPAQAASAPTQPSNLEHADADA